MIFVTGVKTEEDDISIGFGDFCVEQTSVLWIVYKDNTYFSAKILNDNCTLSQFYMERDTLSF